MKIFTEDKDIIIVTEESYDNNGCYLPRRYNLEDGRELELCESQFINATNVNGDGGCNPRRFKLKKAEK